MESRETNRQLRGSFKSLTLIFLCTFIVLTHIFSFLNRELYSSKSYRRPIDTFQIGIRPITLFMKESSFFQIFPVVITVFENMVVLFIMFTWTVKGKMSFLVLAILMMLGIKMIVAPIARWPIPDDQVHNRPVLDGFMTDHHPTSFSYFSFNSCLLIFLLEGVRRRDLGYLTNSIIITLGTIYINITCSISYTNDIIIGFMVALLCHRFCVKFGMNFKLIVLQVFGEVLKSLTGSDWRGVKPEVEDVYSEHVEINK